MMLALLCTLAFAAPAAPSADEATPDWSGDARARTDAQVSVVSALLEAGLTEKALAIVGELRAEGADDPRIDVLQARALHATGLTTEAREMLEKHTRTAKRDPAGWAALGVVLADGGDLPGAIRALERAHTLSPDDPTILNNLGYARLAHGDVDKAIELFRQSLVRDPAQPRTRNNLGFALARQERDAEALQAFRAAGPEADARYNLGVACVNRGDRANAIAQFNAALEAAPGHPAAAAALERLLQEAP